MRIRFLVLAHDHAPMLWRLCARLRATPGATVTVQWDSETPLPELPDGLDIELRPSPAPSAWGDGAQLDAATAALRAQQGLSFDWLVVLSGSCYPIRPLGALAELLATTPHLAFLETPEDGTVPAPDGAGDAPLMYLQRRYFFRYRWVPRRVWRLLPAWGRHVVEAGVQRAIRALTSERQVWMQRRPRGFSPGIGRRVHDHPFTVARPCRKGSDWFAIARPVYDDLLAQLAAEPALVEHFRHTYCPNESLFHTLLLPRWEGVNAGHNLHYQRFVGHRAHPEVLGQADWDELVGSGCFLARKVDPSDAAFLDRVDRELLGA
jgi:hypothetical protein